MTGPNPFPNIALRRLKLEDIPQVAQIEKEAFPTLWPPTPFKRELENRLARYLVAWTPATNVSTQIPSSTSLRQPSQPTGYGLQATGPKPDPQGPKPADKPLRRGGFQTRPYQDRPLFSRLFSGAKERVSSDKPKLSTDYVILGFVGMWFMADEAHITAIAVRGDLRGRGIGELLLLGSIELALKAVSRVVTLEVRVSNYIAQRLYEKYGFKKTGVRKRYYVDNGEDAFIMSTDDINSDAYQEKLKALRAAYVKRHGDIHVVLS